MDKRVETHTNFGKTLRLSPKVFRLLMKKTRNIGEAYDVLRFLCVYYEEAYGCELISPSDTELRLMVRDVLRDDTEKKMKF
jgi:hypothetical protein